MTFQECVHECIGNENLVNQFNRLDATEDFKDRSDLAKTVRFVEFIHSFIWPIANR
jgi:hypothetical protein